MTVLFYIQAFICLNFYFFLILSFFIGWLRTKRYLPDLQNPAVRVSILIPCRNEAENIRELAAILNNQDYPDELLEIIWIDDHSTDRSGEILEELTFNKNHRHLVRLPEHISGKKAALKAGMDIANGELILLTDADSRPGTRWVKTMAKFFKDTGNDLILGPVILDPAHTAFGQIQKLEYLSLVTSSAGAAGIGSPVMAQGPNIAVRASDYRSVVNDLDDRFTSGDDMFLLQAIKSIPGKKIGYLLNDDAWVRTPQAESLSAFLVQRRRWASKAKGYRDPFMILTTLLVFAANLEILAALVCAAVGWVPISVFVILFIIKFLADLPLLLSSMVYFRCTNLLWWVIPVQLLYPLYIAVAGVISQVTTVKWRRG